MKAEDILFKHRLLSSKEAIPVSKVKLLKLMREVAEHTWNQTEIRRQYLKKLMNGIDDGPSVMGKNEFLDSIIEG